MVDLEAFTKLLKEQCLVNDEDISSIAKLCTAEKDPKKISLKKVDEQLKNSESAFHHPTLTMEKAQEKLKEIFEHLKRFIATHEANLVDNFSD